MDPKTGRFLTEDPIKDGMNWYGYVGNNPNNFMDPTGLGRTEDDYHNTKMEGMTQEERAEYQKDYNINPNTGATNPWNGLNGGIPDPSPDFDYDYKLDSFGVDGDFADSPPNGWSEYNEGRDMIYVWREDGRTYSTVYRGVKHKEGSSSTDDPIIVETATVVITERGVTQKDGDKPKRSEPTKIDSKKLRNTIIEVASKPENLSDPNTDTWACDTVFYEIEDLMEFDIRRYFDRIGPDKDKDITTNIIFNLVKRAKTDPSILQLNELEAQRYANNDYLVIGLLKWTPLSRQFFIILSLINSSSIFFLFFASFFSFFVNIVDKWIIHSFHHAATPFLLTLYTLLGVDPSSEACGRFELYISINAPICCRASVTESYSFK